MSEGPHGDSTGEQWTAAVPPGQSAPQGRHDPGMRSYEPLASPAVPPLQHTAPPAQQPTQTVLAPVTYGQVPPGVIDAPKSVGVAFVLTFFFGPLGMLYSTVTGALVLLGITLVVSLLTGLAIALITLATFGFGSFLALLAPLVGLPIWITSMIWGCLAASGHNERVRAQHAQHAHAYAQYGAAFAQQNAQRPADPGYGAPRW